MITAEDMAWNPTPEQFKRYLEREIELAAENIASTGSSVLSSAETVRLARIRLRRKRGAP